MTKSALVIGGGIIGVTSAIYLAEAGFAVTVVDRTGICEETSSGNAAALAFSDILPMAHKGFLKKVPGWMMDPLGPLSIAPNYALKIAPWLMRVAKESQSKRRDAAVAAQAGLMKLAEAEMLALIARAGLDRMLRRDGSLELYDSEAAFQSALKGWEFRKRHGVPFEHVRGARLSELQPGLSETVKAGTFSPSWITVNDPKDFGQALWAYAEKLGAHLVMGEAALVRGGERGAFAVLKDGTELQADILIIAAGAWSQRLARQVGDEIPLETERGYNTTLPKGAFDAKRMLIFSSDAFVLTPLENSIRIGGAVELAGLDNPPNFKRSKAMLTKAKRYLPGLKTEDGKEWMGFRPSLPDTLPAIGKAKGAENIIHAFGHGHLGLTQSAATGRLVRDLARGEKPALDLAPFSPQRF
jgi:D-amino-acid dehydrogenase